MTMNKAKLLYVAVTVFNVLIWGGIILTYYHASMFLSLCLLAYGFGLRHGLDADHITAIDNVTRKLVQEGKNSIGVGLFFSLGHASVVILLTAAVAVASTRLANYLPILNKAGGFFGGIFSASFLLIFGLINFFIFYDVLKKRHQLKQGKEITANIKITGFLSSFLTPLFSLINKSWHMFLVGFLFGLGFDTATEIALLSMSASRVAHQDIGWTIMILPILFTVGMCLVDVTSGLFILKACRWAFEGTERKLHYNLIITFFSFVTAFLIGGYEMIKTFAGYQSASFQFISTHSAMIGCFIIGLFVVTFFKFRYSKLQAQ